MVWSFVVMLIGPLTRLNEHCGKYSAACGVGVGFLRLVKKVKPGVLGSDRTGATVTVKGLSVAP